MAYIKSYTIESYIIYVEIAIITSNQYNTHPVRYY